MKYMMKDGELYFRFFEGEHMTYRGKTTHEVVEAMSEHMSVLYDKLKHAKDVRRELMRQNRELRESLRVAKEKGGGVCLS